MQETKLECVESKEDFRERRRSSEIESKVY